MARAIRSGKIKRGKYHLYRMPQLNKGKDHYQQYLGGRLEMFPPNEDSPQVIPADIILDSFQHKLCYDAESVFWLLLYWCIQVQPDSRGKNKDAPKTTHWSNLTGGSGTDDPRTFFLGPFPSNVCHEAYQPLEGLLEKMAEQLKGHPELTKERDKEEYLHEAFQRIIFEFISSQYQEPFMYLPTNPIPRKIDPTKPMTQPLSTTQRSSRSSHSTRSTHSSRKSLPSVNTFPDISTYSDVSSRADVSNVSILPNFSDHPVLSNLSNVRPAPYDLRKRKYDHLSGDKLSENQSTNKKLRRK